MLDANKKYTAADLTLMDDGSLDTVVLLPDGTEWRYGDTSAYRDESGALDFERWAQEVVLPDMDADLDILARLGASERRPVQFRPCAIGRTS